MKNHRLFLVGFFGVFSLGLEEEDSGVSIWERTRRPASGLNLEMKWRWKVWPSRGATLVLPGGMTMHSTFFTVNFPTRTELKMDLRASTMEPSAT